MYCVTGFLLRKQKSFRSAKLTTYNGSLYSGRNVTSSRSGLSYVLQVPNTSLCISFLFLLHLSVLRSNHWACTDGQNKEENTSRSFYNLKNFFKVNIIYSSVFHVEMCQQL